MISTAESKVGESDTCLPQQLSACKDSSFGPFLTFERRDKGQGLSIPDVTLTTRDQMIAGAMELLRRKGASATSFRDVIRFTGTPRGSIGFHFPNGKQELLNEAVSLSCRLTTERLIKLFRDQGTRAGVKGFIDWWKAELEGNNFEGGCPVVAAVIESSSDVSLASEAVLPSGLMVPSPGGHPNCPTHGHPNCSTWPG